MPKVVIIYYSRTGNTEAMAKAVAQGVEDEGVETEVKRVDYATSYDFMSADAVAFGSPCYFAYMSGKLKDFFDRMLQVLDKVIDKPAAAFISAGEETDGGKEALLSIETMMNYFMLRRVADGIICPEKPEKTNIEECKKLGSALAKAAKK